jgi:hypothetical protein
MSIYYNIYHNTGAGDPINYGTRVATTDQLTVNLGALAYPSTWSFGVRAENEFGEEQNLDCEVTIVLDANGNDISTMPAAPTALRAFATARGGIRVEWGYPQAAAKPLGFHVYIGPGPPDYTTIAATVSFNAGRAGVWIADLAGLSDGTTYSIGVRAFNSTIEETNTATVTATADATGPAAVHNLAGIASS